MNYNIIHIYIYIFFCNIYERKTNNNNNNKKQIK